MKLLIFCFVVSLFVACLYFGYFLACHGSYLWSWYAEHGWTSLPNYFIGIIETFVGFGVSALGLAGLIYLFRKVNE
jgi:hypothetical protein